MNGRDRYAMKVEQARLCHWARTWGAGFLAVASFLLNRWGYPVAAVFFGLLTIMAVLLGTWAVTHLSRELFK